MAPNYRAMLEKATFEIDTYKKIVEKQEQIIKALEQMEKMNEKMNADLHEQVLLLRNHIIKHEEIRHTQDELLDAYNDVIFLLYEKYPSIESEAPQIVELLETYKNFKEKEIEETGQMSEDYKRMSAKAEKQ